MPGPKMGPRPNDFDEEVIRQSPTFLKWLQLEPGQKLRYACREFIRGHGEDEERLMRRIMIARRNNIRDHETLKRARDQTNEGGGDEKGSARKRRPATVFSDEQVEKEMDVPAVMTTRSYRTWHQLPHGAEFVYNQKYIKGKEGHDWLLRKNIWRRMRYRRENKKMIDRLKTTPEGGTEQQNLAGDIVDQALMPEEQQETPPAAAKKPPPLAAAAAAAPVKNEDEPQTPQQGQARGGGGAAVAAAAAAANSDQLADQAAVEAAVAAAVSFGKTTGLDMSVVHNPLEEAAARAALDAAAKLAAATAAHSIGTNDTDDVEGLLKDDIDQTALV